jgi:porin
MQRAVSGVRWPTPINAFGTTFDLTKLGVVPGGTIQITWTDRNGSNLSDDAGLGTLLQVQEVFGRGQTLRLTQFWYDQNFIDGAVDWKIGRITFGEDFASFSCDFQNLTFCGATSWATTSTIGQSANGPPD